MAIKIESKVTIEIDVILDKGRLSKQVSESYLSDSIDLNSIIESSGIPSGVYKLVITLEKENE